jgi:hypothetical protein
VCIFSLIFSPRMLAEAVEAAMTHSVMHRSVVVDVIITAAESLRLFRRVQRCPMLTPPSMEELSNVDQLGSDPIFLALAKKGI